MNATANDILRLMEAGRTADAEGALRRKLAEAPSNAEWRTLLARVLVAAGRKPEAIAELSLAVEHAPKVREPRLTLARLANELGQSELAARHARVLTGRDARDSEAWSALGMAAFGLRNKREATRALRRAVEITPGYAAARYNLAAVLADQEHSEEALEQAAAALKHGAKPRGVSLVQTRALIQLDRFEDAERQLLGLLRADANDVEAHGLLVQLRQLRGDEDPLAAMRTAAKLPAAPPRLRLAFADAARRAGAAAEAEAILRELMNTFGPEPMLLSSLATVLQESGRTSEALDAARASIARQPEDAAVAENFVVAALCAGASLEALPVVEKFRARETARSALDHVPPRYRATSRGGRILELVRSRAGRIGRRLARRQPDSPPRRNFTPPSCQYCNRGTGSRTIRSIKACVMAPRPHATCR